MVSSGVFDYLPADDDFINELQNHASLVDVVNALKKAGYEDMARSTIQHYNTLSPRGVPENSFISDLKLVKIFKDWLYNKQIFTVDNDFVENLINTDEVVYIKDALNHLPYKTFYIDFSESEYLKNNLLCDGAFVNVHKANLKDVEPNSRIYKSYTEYEIKYTGDKPAEELWVVHFVRIKGEICYHDINVFSNADFKFPVTNIKKEADIEEYIYKENPLIPSGKRKIKINEQIYHLFINQFLSYLSSYNPDIKENEETKRVYRKPNPNFPPKNKFSEIQAHEVGYKIGSAVRSWKKAHQNKNTASVPTGRKNRPHSVRAHWRRQWYGSGENKEQRLIWINEFFTGLLSNEDKIKDVPVIHKVN